MIKGAVICWSPLRIAHKKIAKKSPRSMGSSWRLKPRGRQERTVWNNALWPVFKWTSILTFLSRIPSNLQSEPDNFFLQKNSETKKLQLRSLKKNNKSPSYSKDSLKSQIFVFSCFPRFKVYSYRKKHMKSLFIRRDILITGRCWFHMFFTPCHQTFLVTNIPWSRW